MLELNLLNRDNGGPEGKTAVLISPSAAGAGG